MKSTPAAKIKRMRDFSGIFIFASSSTCYRNGDGNGDFEASIREVISRHPPLVDAFHNAGCWYGAPRPVNLLWTSSTKCSVVIVPVED
jgi:hypothetical protein